MKKIILFITMIAVSVVLTSCGISSEDFSNSVENYQIFDDNNSYGLETVSDYIKKIESFDGEDSKITTLVTTFWSSEKLGEDNDFIQRLKQEKGFDYDKNKYYGELSVTVEIFSSVDYSTKEDFTYVYLFSLDKDKVVVPEATAIYYGDSFDYEDIEGTMVGV